jgi:triosephosphate isomerase
MRGFLVAGNWKMNGSNAANERLTSEIIDGMPHSAGVELLICPPYPYLASMASKVAGTDLALGAQSVSEFESGAHTGEVAPAMLRDIGCKYVIVGHSERRAMYGEDNECVARKFAATLKAGLQPILCVGETLEDREAGQTEEIIESQLRAVLNLVGIDAFATAVLAYEPVWAIGTGKTASPEQAQDVHQHIRSILAEQNDNIASQVRILYGGSVNGSNADGLFAMTDIDGGLIGGASLKSADFLAIAAAAASQG